MPGGVQELIMVLPLSAHVSKLFFHCALIDALDLTSSGQRGKRFGWQHQLQNLSQQALGTPLSKNKLSKCRRRFQSFEMIDLSHGRSNRRRLDVGTATSQPLELGVHLFNAPPHEWQ